VRLEDYRHVIWDWNGTLLDDLDLCIEAMNGMLARRGLPALDRARYHAVFDFPVRDYYARLGLPVDEENFRALSAEFIGAYDARRLEPLLQPGAAALLAAIARRGVTQSILSAYEHASLQAVVRHHGVHGHFTGLHGLDNIYAHSKVALGRACLATLQLPPREVLLIGDTLHDHAVAQELGTACALVAHGHHSAARLRATTEHVFPDLRALAAGLGCGLSEADSGCRS
jgi:phosphoglycolate phosphatase